MIDLHPVDGTDTCQDCVTADRFCADHLHAFVGTVATTRDEHKRRMAAIQGWPRVQADERQHSADRDLDRSLRRILTNKPRDMARLLLLAVEVHESRSEAIQLDLSSALVPEGVR